MWARRNPVLDGATCTSEEKNSGEKRKCSTQDIWNLDHNRMFTTTKRIHRSNDCAKVIDTNKRRRYLAKLHPWFHCTSEGHSVADCPRKTSCKTHGACHHTLLYLSIRITSSGEKTESVVIKEQQRDSPQCRPQILQEKGFSQF